MSEKHSGSAPLAPVLAAVALVLSAAPSASEAAGVDEPGTREGLLRRVEALESRLARAEDRASIEKLTRAYGYYIDKKLWDEVVPLFATDATVEISGRGVYRDTKGVDRLFRSVIGRGRNGLAAGELSNHMVLQGIVDVAPDGRTATGRWRAFIQIGMWKEAALWSEGTYDIEYVKRGDVWLFKRMNWYGTFFAPYEQGWARKSFGNNAPSKDHPPDSPPSTRYDAYPGHYVPPFPYANPVTGRPWTLEDTRKYSTEGMDPSAPANAAGANSPLSREAGQASPSPPDSR